MSQNARVCMCAEKMYVCVWSFGECGLTTRFLVLTMLQPRCSCSFNMTCLVESVWR